MRGSYLLKAAEGEMTSWRAAAALAGVSFADWLRDAANAALDAVVPYLDDGSPRPTAAKRARPTGGRECSRAAHHRPGTYCKACGITPA